MTVLIQIHCIQNHSPANLNRDDIGAPKTCYFGGVLRSRISSQCLKRSIRMSREFSSLLGGIRTRRLSSLVAAGLEGDTALIKRADAVLKLCGVEPKKAPKPGAEDEDGGDSTSKALVYTTRAAVQQIIELVRATSREPAEEVAKQVAGIIATQVLAPDMALSGRMLEPDSSAKATWAKLDTRIEASLQVAHAISTHEARPEVDYYVAADDAPGSDAGAGFVDEALFGSACFYKYFPVNGEALQANHAGAGDRRAALAAHTVAALIRGAALAQPTGKQNSFAAHNPPDGILVELRDTPISYANAFARPVEVAQRDITSQSVAQLACYAHDLDEGYGAPDARAWFSPNLRFRLTADAGAAEQEVAGENLRSLDALVAWVVERLGQRWEDVRQVSLSPADL